MPWRYNDYGIIALESRSCVRWWFHAWPFPSQVTTLGKLFTDMIHLTI